MKYLVFRATKQEVIGIFIKQIKRGNLRNCRHFANDIRPKVVQGKTNLKTMTMKKEKFSGDVCKAFFESNSVFFSGLHYPSDCDERKHANG